MVRIDSDADARQRMLTRSMHVSEVAPASTSSDPLSFTHLARLLASYLACVCESGRVRAMSVAECVRLVRCGVGLGFGHIAASH